MTEVERIDLAPDYSVARVINGCWQLTPDHGGGPASRKETLRRFAELVDRGFMTFDCADIYLGTEELLGQFLASAPDRDRVQIHTKFVPDKATLDTLDKRRIDAVIERSLRRLGVERLDLVQFHWWDYSVPGLDAMVERLVHHRDCGRIRLLGATNFNTAQLSRLLEIEPGLVSMQAQYSLLDRRPEKSMLEHCSKSDVGLLAYGALAGGFLSDRYLDQAEPAGMNRSLIKYRLIIGEAGGWSAFQTLLRLLRDIADRHDSRLSQVAARWVLDQPGVAGIILGIGRQSRIEDNLALFELTLDEEDRQRLSTHLRAQPVPPGEPFDAERDTHGIHAGIIKTDLQSKSAEH